MRRSRAAVLVLVVLMVGASGCAYVSRASVSTSGTQGNGTADEPSLSADGRFMAFRSRSNNLVPFDTNGPDGFYADIFVRDAQAGTTERVNLATDGTQADFESSAPSLSSDGRYVAFTSDADNLVPFDTNGSPDVFVRDRGSVLTTRINLATNGAQANGASSTGPASISGDGRYVVFTSSASSLVAGDANAANDIFLRDRQTATTIRVSVATGGGDANGASTVPVISADGRYVAFTSDANNLVAADTNGNRDVFVRDLQTGTTTRVSTDSTGAQATGGIFPGSFGPSISSDGRYVAFESWATNLVAGDTNGIADVFVKDRQTGATSLVSIATSGALAVGGTSGLSSISGDGRYVAFDSLATNLVPGDTNGVGDVFIRDRQSGTTTRASTSNQLAQGNGESYDSAISGDGRYVGFSTAASNLVTPDANGATQDAILRANPLPTVTSSTPTTVARGTTKTITVNGTNLLPGVNATFGSDVTVTAVQWISEKQVKFTIAVGVGAATGLRQVIVFDVGTGPGPLTGAAAPTSITLT